jgi:hypothetical protein
MNGEGQCGDGGTTISRGISGIIISICDTKISRA